MKTIGLLILRIKEYLILTLFVVISLVLIFNNDNTQIRFLRAFAIGFVGTLQSGVSAVPNVFELQNENKYLREKNIELANEVAALKEAKLENIRLSKLLSLKDKNVLGVISAKIVNKSLVQTRNTITINAGENDSIKINMPVVTDDGLVGKIVGVSKNYSIAQILYNKDLRISAKVQRSRVDGIFTYDGVGSLILTNVPKAADVNPGDLIITSDYSNLFPAGIPLGTVIETGNLDNLFKKITVKPAVNFSILEEVFVVKNLPSREKYELEKIFMNK
ncbi:MAG: rod shape-determining protein MreC [Bacteroidetes bacterium]|nr:rod shape-determining protein MreC [Bacteroidota bacterium]MBX7045292.1 rod shape-determining protein MreC [Ignavibacteria bacterium]